MTKLLIPPDLHLNTSFSQRVPGLQVAIDSTSLGSLKTCARKYYYEIICGYVHHTDNVHLIFGIGLHEATELYERKRIEGLDHDQATYAAVKFALIYTWRSDLKRPWPSDDPNKNRETLIRTIVWYLEQFKDDPLETIILRNGKPALEMSFQLGLGYGPSSGGEDYTLCGHMDRVVQFQGQAFVTDKKTTKYTLNEDYFNKYTPENQMSTYSVAGRAILGEPVAGLIVDAAQIAVTFTRFRRGIVTRTETQINEWLTDLRYWLRMAELYAEDQYWPQNDKSCSMYGGCQYLHICGSSPEVRDLKLKALFAKRTWDPLKSREI